jgi:hypothetical protein
MQEENTLIQFKRAFQRGAVSLRRMACSGKTVDGLYDLRLEVSQCAQAGVAISSHDKRVVHQDAHDVKGAL